MELENIILQFLENNKEGMKELISMFLNKVMQVEVNEQIGASKYERKDSRIAHRNGYKKRTLNTKYGKIVLNKPQIREFSFETQIFERYSRVEKALRNAVGESYIQGISTRRMKKVLYQLGVDSISPSSVSNIAKELDEDVDKFLKRPIEKEIRYLFIDATYLKIREDMRYVNKALFIAVGVDIDGYRNILGAKIGDYESEAFWADFFEELKERGLRGVKLVISDGNKGIIKATNTLLGSSWQMCHTHFKSNILKKMPRKKKKWVSIKLEGALQSEQAFDNFIYEMEERREYSIVEKAEKYRYALFNHQAFPLSHHRRIRTTNIVERINKEIKRRSKEIGAFVNDASLLRLAVSILIDINEEWVTGRKYLNMEDSMEEDRIEEDIMEYEEANEETNKKTTNGTLKNESEINGSIIKESLKKKLVNGGMSKESGITKEMSDQKMKVR